MSSAAQSEAQSEPVQPADRRARVAIDLGAESCRVSLLRWTNGVPRIDLIHRIPNGPVHVDGALQWRFDLIAEGIEEGLRKAAAQAPEGIASVAADGWAVDYVRLGPDGQPLGNPYCYRDERSVLSKENADKAAPPEWMFTHTGAQPLRINTAYQLMADSAGGIDRAAPWVNLPEYLLHRLGGRRVAEYTNATHTALVDVETGDWSNDVLQRLNLAPEACPPLVPTGTVVGKLTGPLAELPAFRDTNLIVPACHDTASAIAGICTSLDGAAYICSGTWSLVGTLIDRPITTAEALAGGFTNQGAAAGGFCFHTNVNGMWVLKQCLEKWRKDGRVWELTELIARAESCGEFPGIVAVDAPSLLLDGDMPALLNEQLRACGCAEIEDCAGNEPVFARVIFESLASRYATIVGDLGKILGREIERIHVLGGGSRNRLLTRLTAEDTGLDVAVGNAEGSTIGNFAVQLAASEGQLSRNGIRGWAARLCVPDD